MRGGLLAALVTIHGCTTDGAPPAATDAWAGRSNGLEATNGDETGMKWLAGKTNCLTAKPGEGYCRD